MRHLHNKELRLVIQQGDVRQDGRLRKNYRAHIGRASAETGNVLALACGAGLEPRYIYPYLNVIRTGIPQRICGKCKRRLRKMVVTGDGDGWGVAPSSNTGVKQRGGA